MTTNVRELPTKSQTIKCSYHPIWFFLHAITRQCACVGCWWWWWWWWFDHGPWSRNTSVVHSQSKISEQWRIHHDLVVSRFHTQGVTMKMSNWTTLVAPPVSDTRIWSLNERHHIAYTWMECITATHLPIASSSFPLFPALFPDIAARATHWVQLPSLPPGVYVVQRLPALYNIQFKHT